MRGGGGEGGICRRRETKNMEDFLLHNQNCIDYPPLSEDNGRGLEEKSMTGPTTLTREAAHAARKMYLEINNSTGKRWTIMDLAEWFAVSESTMYRALKGVGPYRNLPPPRTDEQLSVDAAASYQKLLEMTKDLREKEKEGDRMLGELKEEK